MGTITNGIFISNQSLDIITKTGNYRGANISELIPYTTPSSWCGIKAYVQSDNAAFFYIITSDNIVINAYRGGDGTYKFYPLALKSDLNSKPEYSTKYLTNESVSLKMTYNQNVLIIGHSMGNGNPNGHFVYLFCAGNQTFSTGKSFKIAGDFELSYSWADGLNASISASSSQWIQISILYL